MAVQRSADILVDQILHLPGMLDKVKANPEETLRELARQATINLPAPAVVTDKWLYRLVVCSLGTIAIAAIIGAIVLSVRNSSGTPVQILDVLTALGAAAIGAMAGLLAPSPAK